MAPPRRREAAEHLTPRQVQPGAADEAGGQDGAQTFRLPRRALRRRDPALPDELRALVQAAKHLAVVFRGDGPGLFDEFIEALEFLALSRRRREIPAIRSSSLLIRPNPLLLPANGSPPLL